MRINSIIFLLLLTGNLICQTVSNVSFKQEDNKIIINYDLELDTLTFPSNYTFLFFSIDGGQTFNPISTNITGDVGRVSTGRNKEIIWNVLDEKDFLITPNAVFKVELKSNLLEVVFIPGGKFKRTGYDTSANIQVKDFYIGKYEVTQKQWKKIMITNPSLHVDCEECPVENISIADIRVFTEKLYENTGIKFRLPTEIEWEYAASGGQQDSGYIYSGGNDIAKIGWYFNNSGTNTHRVGIKQPNELGLCDMTGNVSEYCSDKCSVDISDPQNIKFAYKGGSYLDYNNSCEIKNTNCIKEDKTKSYIGLRLVIDVESK